VSLPDTNIDDLRRLYGELESQNSTLQARNGELEEKIAKLAARIEYYEEQIILARRLLHAPSREHTPVGQEAFLFDEAEAVADSSVPEPTVEEVTVTRRKKATGHRQQQLAILETREIEYPVTDLQPCNCCGNDLHFVDWQITEKVDVEPAKAIRVLHKEPVYACRNCQAEGRPSPIKAADTMPEQAFPKSIASPSLVAHIAAQKFVMGVPLYRQEQYGEGLGLFISRQTMANWMIQAGKLIAPIYGRMHTLLISQEVIHADETSVQVLKEQGRAATTDSTMWLYRSGGEGPPIALFDYQTTRAGKHAQLFLQGFGGYDAATKQITRKKYLHVDGYAGYDSVPRWTIQGGVRIPDIVLVGCWAHARRKFSDALAVLKKADRKPGKTPAAEQGLKMCNELFEVERKLKEATPAERLAERKIQSVPIVEKFKAWLDEQANQALPKSGFGEAVGYCLNQWTKLTAFLTDGRLELDNNLAERTIKPFVIGRKNWLFANTPKGAQTSALLYSIVETAKENDLIPYEYLKFLFQRLPTIDAMDMVALDKLLPWSKSIPQTCRKNVPARG
jgi:transposase